MFLVTKSEILAPYIFLEIIGSLDNVGQLGIFCTVFNPISGKAGKGRGGGGGRSLPART